MDYAIVIPAKNEELYIGNTLMSLCNQTILPMICAVIDDNSTDNIAHIIHTYSCNYSFVKYYKFNSPINEYKLGGHVVELFNYGRKIIEQLEIKFDYIVKLDSDVEFNANFFENIYETLKLF
jgi:glycosyltransferase involved in cell wall biosynthesis